MRKVLSPFAISGVFRCVFFGLCISTTVWASEGAHTGIAAHILRAEAIAADLDGDNIPDLASGTNLGHTSQGYAYRVDLDLSKNQQAKPFRVFSSESTGLDIQAIDVDGDNDLDLVITSRLLRKPVAIWINDGNGNFSPGDASQYASSIWHQDSTVKSSEKHWDSACYRQPRQPDVALGDSDFGICVAPVRALMFECFLSHHLLQSGSARFRAPPSFVV